MARRPAREPAFGSDSFLDVIANLVGIVLIIIVLVAARIRDLPNLMPADSVEASLQRSEDPAAAAVESELAQLEAELNELQRRLLATLAALDLGAEQARSLENQRRAATDQQRAATERLRGQEQLAIKGIADSERQAIEQQALRTRIVELQKAIQDLEQRPPDRRLLRFHLPVSRPVSASELLFELRENRVTFVDLQAFLDQIKQATPQKVELLRKKWEVTDVTDSVGAFRLRYVIARERTSGLDRAFSDLPPTQERGFAYGLDTWELVPLVPVRGETLTDALAVGSYFRRVVDTADAEQVVLTFFVYADSFGMYRELRDYLYDRGFMVAGRPMGMDRPISGSRSGTTSRGQ